MRGQELERVLVARDDNDIVSRPLGFVGERADEIVGLIAGLADGAAVQGLNNTVDVRDLRAHALRHGRPLGFVVLELLMA